VWTCGTLCVCSTHTQVLSERQFCNTFSRACITGLAGVPAVHAALPTADAKLAALLPRLGFGSRRGLLAFLHATGAGDGGGGAGLGGSAGPAGVASLLREYSGGEGGPPRGVLRPTRGSLPAVAGAPGGKGTGLPGGRRATTDSYALPPL
jgi:hypothetical protein